MTHIFMHIPLACFGRARGIDRGAGRFCRGTREEQTVDQSPIGRVRRVLSQAGAKPPSSIVSNSSYLSALNSYPKIVSLFFSFFFSIPFVYCDVTSPFFSLSLLLIILVVTGIRGHMIAGSSPTSPLRFVPCFFMATRLQPFLPSWTRVDCAYPSYLYM